MNVCVYSSLVATVNQTAIEILNICQRRSTIQIIDFYLIQHQINIFEQTQHGSYLNRTWLDWIALHGKHNIETASRQYWNYAKIKNEKYPEKTTKFTYRISTGECQCSMQAVDPSASDRASVLATWFFGDPWGRRRVPPLLNCRSGCTSPMCLIWRTCGWLYALNRSLVIRVYYDRDYHDPVAEKKIETKQNCRITWTSKSKRRIIGNFLCSSNVNCTGWMDCVHLSSWIGD